MILKHVKSPSLTSLILVITLLFSISIIALSASYRIPPSKTISTRSNLAKIDAIITPIFRVKPVIIYNYREHIETSETYYDLVEGLNISIMFKPLIYRFGGEKPISINESYSIDSSLKTPIYSHEYPLVEIVEGRNPLRLLLVIDYAGLEDIIKTIEDEIHVVAPKYEYTISIQYMVKVIYSGGMSKTYILSPIIKVVIDREGNRIVVEKTDTYKTFSYEERLEKINHLSPLPLSISTSRTIFFYSTIILGLSLTALTLKYMVKTSSRRSLIEKYGKIIVKGKIIHESDKPVILLEDPDRLASIAKRLGENIIYDRGRKELIVVSEKAIYKYRLNGDDE